MSRDDLNSVLELGWQLSRETWQLLAPNEDGEFTTIGAEAIGRALDQLAYDLDRIGFGKPARLAYSIAFVLNSLANQAITFDGELAEKTSQLVSVLAEMLLELEAKQEISIEEPTEIVEELKATWGLEFEREEPVEIAAEPEFAPVEVAEPTVSDSDLTSNSEELVSASGSLLDRVLREGDFPHTASLGRIHHLAMLVRDQILMESRPHLEIDTLGYAEELHSMPTVRLEESPVQFVIQDTVEEELPAIEPAMVFEADRVRPSVLILDRSPFFRMLLTSAVESAGYEAYATEDVAEAVASQSWNMIICGLDNLSDTVRETLDSCVAASNAGLIVLDQEESDSAESISVRRADIAGLLSVLESQLGSFRGSVRRSA